MRLAVNIDHIATIREARKAREPEPVAAAILAELAGAQGITVHLRGDRRHIKERDVELLRQVVSTKLNIEMAATPEMTGIAARIKPDQVTLVPEQPHELTTQGGLDVVANRAAVGDGRARPCARRASASASSSIPTRRRCARRARSAPTRSRSTRAPTPTPAPADAPGAPRGRAAGGRRRRARRARGARRPRPHLREHSADRRNRGDRRAQHRPQHRRARVARRPRPRRARDDRADGVADAPCARPGRVPRDRWRARRPAAAAAAQQNVSFRTDDGVTPARAACTCPARPGPGMILLHMQTRSREDWQPLAGAARRRGFRRARHRPSRPRRVRSGSSRQRRRGSVPDDAGREGGRTFLATRATWCQGASASPARRSAPTWPSCSRRRIRPSGRWSLLSAGLDYRGLRTEAAMTQVRRSAPALLVASDEDSYAANSARKLAQQQGGTRDLRLLSGAGHGTVMLGRQPDLVGRAGGLVPAHAVMIDASALSVMKPESIVLAVAGIFFGLIVGWVIGSQQASPSRLAAPMAAVQQPSTTQAPAAVAGRRRPLAQLDEAQGAGAPERRPPERRRRTRRACSSATCTSTRSGSRTRSSGTTRR